MSPPRRTRRRIPVPVLLALACLAAAARAAALQAPAPANVTDAALVSASEGRVVRVGPATGTPGRPTTVPLEVYVARVLAGEGERDAAVAAREALAVAIRTYAVANAGRHAREGFDLCDSTHCQVLRAATPATRRAVLATAGQVLTYEGAPAEVFYSASCGGYSESAEAVWPGAALPYLQARPDDVHEGDAPWALTLSARTIEQALASSGFRGRLRAVRVVERTASGRAARVELDGLSPSTIPGDRFRAAVGPNRLRSTAFSVTRTGAAFRFEGRGFGHGVGMCVIGAGRRAARGEQVEAILDRYYPGLVLARIGGTPVRASAPGPASVAPEPVAAAPQPALVVPPEPVRRPVRRVVLDAASLSAATAGQVEKLTSDAHASLSAVLGVSIAPITVRVHDSIESFGAATGQSWWVHSVSAASTIHLVPLAALGPAGEWEAAIRTAVADLLLADALTRRPLWVRVGAARYFGRGGTQPSGEPPEAGVCPSDAALTGAISSAARREAEAQAEACFLRQYARTGNWREVR